MRSLDARIQAALAAYDEDTRWELIGGMMDECPDDVLDASSALLRGEHGRQRTLGADLLGRLVGSNPDAGPAAGRALLATLQHEHKSNAIASMVAALGHIGDAGALA